MNVIVDFRTLRVHGRVVQIQVRLDEPCKVVCKLDGLSEDQATAFKKKIDDEYRINM